MNTALLIIDVQRAISSGADEAFESRRVIDRINQVSGLFRSAGLPVVIIQHEDPGGPLGFETDGWKLDPDLKVLPSDIYLRKTATDSFHNTELHSLLQARGVKNLVICGLQSEFCVDTTTRRALALGYPVTLVADGHSTMDNGNQGHRISQGQGSSGYPVTLVADGHSTMDNGILKAEQISAHHNKTLSSIDSFGVRAKAVPASKIRIEI